VTARQKLSGMKSTMPRPKIQPRLAAGMFYADGAPISRTSIFEPSPFETALRYRCGTCGQPINIDQQLLCTACMRSSVPVSPVRTSAYGKQKLLLTIGANPGINKSQQATRPPSQQIVDALEDKTFDEYFHILMNRSDTAREKLCTASSRLVFNASERVKFTGRLQGDGHPVFVRSPSPSARRPQPAFRTDSAMGSASPKMRSHPLTYKFS
jgi:hypothetical protein